MAEYHHRTGQGAKAKSMLEEATKAVFKSPPMARALIRLRHGLLALHEGRPADALGHYRRADAIFSGWFLIREHMAKALAETGKVDEALAIYLEVIEFNADPAFMSAVADFYESRGDAEQVAQWRKKAAVAFDARVARYPQAMTGHALDYYLEHGAADKALRLAQQNHTLRPGGEAKVKLAAALIRTGNVQGARTRIEEALASPYDTAPLHATASVLYAKLGDEARAKKHADRANVLAKDAMSGVQWLAAHP
jgi:tetratricopeptide (TPR) repeat protein